MKCSSILAHNYYNYNLKDRSKLELNSLERRANYIKQRWTFMMNVIRVVLFITLYLKNLKFYYWVTSLRGRAVLNFNIFAC